MKKKDVEVGVGVEGVTRKRKLSLNLPTFTCTGIIVSARGKSPGISGSS